MEKFNLQFHSTLVAILGSAILFGYPLFNSYINLPEKTGHFGGVLFFLGIVGLSFSIGSESDEEFYESQNRNSEDE